MKLHITESERQGDALISKLFIDGVYQCLILEDWEEGPEHRIPRGTYKLAIRTEGRIHSEYLQRFSSFHKGMIQVIVPGRRWILFHIGNSPEDTLGCSLVGTTNKQPGKIEESTKAYIPFYAKVIEPLLQGNEVIAIYDPVTDHYQTA